MLVRRSRDEETRDERGDRACTWAASARRGRPVAADDHADDAGGQRPGERERVEARAVQVGTDDRHDGRHGQRLERRQEAERDGADGRPQEVAAEQAREGFRGGAGGVVAHLGRLRRRCTARKARPSLRLVTCHDCVGIHTRMVDGPRSAQRLYGTSCTVTPSGSPCACRQCRVGPPVSGCRSVPSVTATPSPDSLGAMSSSTWRPSIDPNCAGRSVDSRQYTCGPRSTATQSRTASMRGSGS